MQTQKLVAKPTITLDPSHPPRRELLIKLVDASQAEELMHAWGVPAWAAEERAEQERIVQEIAKTHPLLAKQLTKQMTTNAKRAVHQKQPQLTSARKPEAGSETAETK